MKISPYPSGDSIVKRVSTDWLADKTDADGIMIIDVQPNVHDYIMGHIPGSIYLNESLFRSSWNNLPAAYVDPESVQPIFNRCGLLENKPVVIYSGSGRYSRCTACLGDGLEQNMMAYSLIRFGHNNIFILDGGIEKWKENGHSLTKTFPQWTSSNFNIRLRRDYYISYQEFKKIMDQEDVIINIKDQEDVIIFDARPIDSYLEGGLWQKKGHIPGEHSACHGDLS